MWVYVGFRRGDGVYSDVGVGVGCSVGVVYVLM